VHNRSGTCSYKIKAVEDSIAVPTVDCNKNASDPPELEFEVECILDQRKSATATKPFLVRWKGYDADHDTWEPMESVANCEALERWLNPSTTLCAYEEERALRMETNKVAMTNLGLNGANPSTQVAKRSRRGAASSVDLFALEERVPPLALGDQVRAVYKHDQGGLKQRCRGVVRKTHPDNTYDIEYVPNSDGIVEVEFKKPRRWIEKTGKQTKK